MLNGHGDDLHLSTHPIKYNFSSNVYYKGCPSSITTHLAQQLNAVENYPSPTAEELNPYAAEKHHLPHHSFLFTNGATEAFYLIAQLFTGRKAAIVAPTFSEYEDACRIHGVAYTKITKKQISTSSADLLFICNPNNPDGSVISVKELEKYIQQKPNTTFVIDEAYVEFTNKVTSIVPLVVTYSNLIVVKSLTKTFAIPGLRLGYVVSSLEIIQHLLAFKMPWSVNTLAIAVGKYIFQHYDALRFSIEELLAETEVFKKQLQTIPMLEVIESNTSYFLVKLKQGTATSLKQYLIAENGILVRDATNFCIPNGEYVRLAVQSKEANEYLINAFLNYVSCE